MILMMAEEDLGRRRHLFDIHLLFRAVAVMFPNKFLRSMMMFEDDDGDDGSGDRWSSHL
ncbi:hypothetical protein Hdeb2414_s0005g00157611 [Helianthus debilis subsp. tardiflorus]